MQHRSHKAWPRRAWLRSVGAVGISGLGGVVYRNAPKVLREVARETREPMTRPLVFPKSQAWPDTGLYAAWIGHSTVLLKIDGVTVLTDPIFSDRAGVRVGPVTFGIKRMVAPAVAIRQLPKIDLILLSHAHMDHFDLPSLRALENRGTTVVTAANTGDLLRVRRYRRVHELAWGDHARVGDVECTAFEVKHWGARMRNDTFRGYNGYVLDTGRRRVVFAGDTALTPSFRALRSSRPFDLAIMPIGSYNPWVRNHCTPEQAWHMANDAGAEFLLPVHHQTFRLSREPLLEPIERFYAAACSQIRRIATHAIGQEFQLA